MPSFRIKRPHSPDDNGISNYKRTRLIEDLQNLTINDKTPTKVVKKYGDDQVWKLVSGQSRVEGDLFDRILGDLRKDNLKVIKWYDGAKLIYQAWLAWFEAQIVGQMEIDDLNGQSDGRLDERLDEFGYEPMAIDS